MILCHDCGQQEPIGTIFCTECGGSLLELGGKSAVSDDLDLVQAPELTGKGFDTVSDKSEIVFVIPASGRHLAYPIGREIRIGRSQLDADIQPELNLYQDGGADAGVSRNHAFMKLDEKGQHIILIDQNSTNGTMLNHFLLPPELPYPIRHGDEIQFGNLLVHVFFK